VQAAATPPAPPPAETQAASVPSTPPPAETAAAVAAPPAETAAPAPTEAPELDPKAAAKEKNTARTLLERGKHNDAIEAGERSVALDPTDGEAWLILGAAYQEKGDMKNARRSYKACLEQGKRGPKYECAAMPH
jgi:Flp pilus assembly protein TadD